jgi:hypothetical protein
MSEHGSRRAGGGGSRGGGRRSASAGGVGDKLEGLAGQLSGVFAKRRGGGGRRGGGDESGYDAAQDAGHDAGYGSYDERSYDDRFGEEPAETGSGGRRGRGRASRRGAAPSGGGGDLPPKDWWMKVIDYPRYGKRGWRHWMPSIKQMLSLFLAFLFRVFGLVA